MDTPNRQEHRQTNVARSNLEQLAPKQSLIVLPHQHNQAHSKSQHRPKREQRSLIRQFRQVIALQHIGSAETQVAPGNTQPHNEARKTRNVKQPSVGSALTHNSGHETNRTHSSRNCHSVDRHAAPVNPGEQLGGVTIKGHRVQHTGRGVQARVTGRQNRSQNNCVHHCSRASHARPLKHQGERRVSHISLTVTQQVGVGVRNQETNNRNSAHIEQHDPPEHALNSPGHILAGVTRLACSHTNQLSTLERETSDHKH